MNLLDPAIHEKLAEPEKLQSWLRRFIVVSMGASFVSDSDQDGCEAMMFQNEPKLRTFSRRQWLHKFMFGFPHKAN